MKRTLQEWANLAEIIGGVAIILSLLFVGLQVSENSKQVRSETAHNVTAGLLSWYNELGGSAQASANFRKGMSAPQSLSPEEAVQFLMTVHSVMLIYQTMYFLGTEVSERIVVATSTVVNFGLSLGPHNSTNGSMNSSQVGRVCLIGHRGPSDKEQVQVYVLCANFEFDNSAML